MNRVLFAISIVLAHLVVFDVSAQGVLLYNSEELKTITPDAIRLQAQVDVDWENKNFKAERESLFRSSETEWMTMMPIRQGVKIMARVVQVRKESIDLEYWITDESRNPPLSIKRTTQIPLGKSGKSLLEQNEYGTVTLVLKAKKEQGL